jgi:hypothetical protein
VGAGLPAIWREATAKSNTFVVSGLLRQPGLRLFPQPIVGMVERHTRTPTAFARRGMKGAPVFQTNVKANKKPAATHEVTAGFSCAAFYWPSGNPYAIT